MVRNFKPDCITLDLEMPRMNGLQALDIIMREIPTPILVVSSISTEGAAITLEALDKGAMDYIPKTQTFVAINIISIKDELLRKVKAIVGQRPTSRKAFMAALNRRQDRQTALEDKDANDRTPIAPSLINKDHSVLAIGVSTGGPPVVQHILKNLDSDFPIGILVAQHMPATFTKPFAERLNKLSPLQVKEAVHHLEFAQWARFCGDYRGRTWCRRIGKLEGRMVDLVVTDWNMPEMNGAELVKKLCDDDAFMSVPIVMITTRGMKDDVVTAMKLVVNAYVIKPFTPAILKQKLDAIL